MGLNYSNKDLNLNILIQHTSRQEYVNTFFFISIDLFFVFLFVCTFFYVIFISKELIKIKWDFVGSYFSGIAKKKKSFTKFLIPSLSYPTKMYIWAAPYLHQKCVNWALNMALLLLLCCWCPNYTTRRFSSVINILIIKLNLL